MNRKLTQLHLGDWEHGLAKPIAVLSIEPVDITRRTGLIFETTRDDLDYMSAALFRTDSGIQVALTRHHHAPMPGTEVVVHERTDNLGAALSDVLATLAMDVNDSSWMHSDIH